ncbi:Uncharacterized protein TCAP_04361 [Tolypocladium capitatum]|uniref:Yeast cell wall synthesis Kre9/Knh1-like N-terminal domain-containing protein n=1 Tax=Tolypocladium capitatum TaxID=45235 RepID=A0A2K3QDV0_9HYPO|nr:Uncharacterized protein TCAP_04361 [Tolypocladium capitatum]
MRFGLSATALLAMAASAFAQTADFDPIFTPKANEVIPAGSTYVVTWEAPAKYAADTVSIHLIGGDSQDKQVPLLDIAAGVKNSALSYSWQVDASLGAAKIYGLVFKLESNPAIFQYSNPFQIKGSGSKQAGAPTVTLTTSTGIKTVTLSSTTVPLTTAISYTNTSTLSSNSTTLAPKPSSSLVLVTSTTLLPPTTTAPAPVPTKSAGAGPVVSAGPLSVLGGLFIALLAL